MKLLPSDPLVQHVKGHQDDDALVCTPPLPAQLNCEADALATESLEATPAPIPLVPVFSTFDALSLHVNDLLAHPPWLTTSRIKINGTRCSMI
jgi:hypothetical protein